MVTSSRYQPAAFAVVVGAATSCGAVLASVTVTLSRALPPMRLAVQVKVAAAVSVDSTTVLQPLLEPIAESASLTFQLTVTSPTYQPLSPSVPLTTGAITGGVSSVSMVQACVAGEASRLPATSRARTAKLCAPSARPVNDSGEAQSTKAAPSTLHSSASMPESASVAEKAKVA